MTRLLAGICLTILASVGWARSLAAQDLVVTNARILDGKGGVIERGSVVVRAGKVASVSPGPAAAIPGARSIDAQGKTVMPGFIDAHRHLVQGDPAQWLEQRARAQMQAFLDAGFTTVLSAIDPPQVLELRQRIQQGKVKGPRLFAAGFAPLAGPAQAGAPLSRAIRLGSTHHDRHGVQRSLRPRFCRTPQSKPSRTLRKPDTTTSRRSSSSVPTVPKRTR